MLPAAPGLAMNASVLARVREQRGQPRERAVRRRPAPLGTRRAGSIEAGLARLTALVLPLDRGRAADGALGCGPRRGVAPVAILAILLAARALVGRLAQPRPAPALQRGFGDREGAGTAGQRRSRPRVQPIAGGRAGARQI